MSHSCKGLCERYPKLTPTYRDGKKSCRHCGYFLITQESLCQCCRCPLAFRGRANQRQLLRRAKKRLQMEVFNKMKFQVSEYEKFSLSEPNFFGVHIR